MKTKSTLGEKFLKTFINLRQQHPVIVADLIENWLLKYSINYTIYQDTECQGLLRDFFGDESYIFHINPQVKVEDEPIIIGKGVCFDTGGYNLKKSMEDMYYDKNGALLAIAAGIDNNTPALAFIVSNFINDNVLPGQILKDPYTGLKILIEDTDAEGRMGLAHCIGLAHHLKYRAILTIATLTGHAHMITGDRTYAMVHSNEKGDLAEILVDMLDCEEHAHLELWPAPFHKDYDKSIISKIKGADIGNCGSFKGAGTSTAFSFLKRFSKETHHIHLDIAAMMLDKQKNGYVWGLPEVSYLLELLK
jgi:leucyl aminopeptidase